MSTVINIFITLILIPWPPALMMSPMMMAAPDFRNSRSSLISATLILGYPVIVFAFLKLIDYHFWGTNVTTWLIVVSIIAGGIIFLYGIPGMLINLGRGIKNEGYFKNDSYVFYDGNKISVADPVSFSVITDDRFYAKDNKHVYYMGKIVKDADPMTFTPIKDVGGNYLDKETFVYWKDKANVYYNAKKIEGADVGTFQHLKSLYGKDRNHVYYGNTNLSKANPEKFRFLEEGIATDEASIFVFNKLINIPVDLPSFEVVRNGDHLFCKDKNNVYLLLYENAEPLVQLDGADVATFTLLERYYAKDKNHVYFYGYSKLNTRALIHLTGADPDKFTVGFDESTNSEATDGLNYYMAGKSVKV
jgi:hypothetical protein